MLEGMLEVYEKVYLRVYSKVCDGKCIRENVFKVVFDVHEDVLYYRNNRLQQSLSLSSVRPVTDGLDGHRASVIAQRHAVADALYDGCREGCG